jgi:hypothetical protein
MGGSRQINIPLEGKVVAAPRTKLRNQNQSIELQTQFSAQQPCDHGGHNGKHNGNRLF